MADNTDSEQQVGVVNDSIDAAFDDSDLADGETYHEHFTDETTTEEIVFQRRVWDEIRRGEGEYLSRREMADILRSVADAIDR